MTLLYAAALLSAGLVFARLLYVGTRRTTTPWWAKEGPVSVLILMLVGVISLGIGFLLESLLAWEQQIFGWGEVAAIAGFAVAGAVAWKLLGRALPRADERTVDGSPATAGPGPATPGHGAAPSTATELSPKAPRKAA